MRSRVATALTPVARAVVAALIGLTGGTSVLATAGDHPLADAVERREGSAVLALLAESVDVNAAQPDGATALHWAAHWNDLETAGRLIAAGADVNAANELGATPLSLASLNASAEMGRALLRAGADANAAMPSGETVLMRAARTGNPDLVRALLAAGAHIDSPGRHFLRQTPLMWAASEGHARVVHLLLEAGASVEARSQHGTTALLLAARNGNVETARSLLDAGADVNGAEPVLSFDARIDVEEAQTSGRSPLLIAAASQVATSGWEYGLEVKPSTHEALALFLLERGADPNVPDSIGRTALHAAVETGRLALVKEMLAAGADPNARLTEAPFVRKGDFVSYENFSGATPLWLASAARVPDVEILRALLDAGGDAALAADDGTTPLMAAVGMVQNEARQADEREALVLVRVLVAQDIDLDAGDRGGRTAMHGAARLARNSLIALLAEHGATVDIADARGQTPLDVGTVSRPLHPDTAALLRSLGGTSDTGTPAVR
ncbi:MAG: ankyrin repeat domain-containing protein [Acidobacteria bacterium]|nr:ankyrin repeat domain-containing protein [Acidobacteriota bacterium]